MRTYRTSEVARIIGVHSNTVRLYEKWNLIPEAERLQNGYRVFNDFHIEQFKLARRALQVEVLQNGLRKRAIEIIKASAKKDLTGAKRLAETYIQEIRQEQKKAEEAIESVKQILGAVQAEENLLLKRKETADYLQISIDTLRNWEMNGLLTVKRRKNGYRVYTSSDIRRLKIIRSLRCANYSLAAILRMLSALSRDPKADIRKAINTPDEGEEIIAVCDKLLISLKHAEKNARLIKEQLEKMDQGY